MSGLFYNLGKKVGPKIRKARWLWQSITGTEADAIKVEHEVGMDLAHQIRNQLGLDPSPQAKQILNEIGNNLAGRVSNKSRKFYFEAVNGSEPNAFALPGGFIFVTRPLLDLCQWNKDEIAFILGHEMSHIIRGHAMDRIISNSAISTVSRAAPVRGLLAGWFRTVGVKFLESAYSQDLESEADKLGARLVKAAGYNPGACEQLLSRLAKLKPSDSKTDLGIYFSSHPAFEKRIQNINNLLKKETS
ncbi:MAG: M48 family metallopeptidase [Phycisphaerales bacterium]